MYGFFTCRTRVVHPRSPCYTVCYLFYLRLFVRSVSRGIDVQRKGEKYTPWLGLCTISSLRISYDIGCRFGAPSSRRRVIHSVESVIGKHVQTTYLLIPKEITVQTWCKRTSGRFESGTSCGQTVIQFEDTSK